MSWNTASDEASTVVLFLTECTLKPGDAISNAKALMAAGFTSREKLLKMTETDVKRCLKSAANRKKFLAYLSQDPPLSPPPSKKLKSAESSQSPFTTDAPSISRVATAACRDVVVTVNRSPVMILWAAVVAHQNLSFDWNTALSMASAVASLNARAKGISIGTRQESPLYDMGNDVDAKREIYLLGREVPVRCTTDRILRGVSETGVSIAPVQVHNYLQNAFKENLASAFTAFCILSDSISAEDISRDQGRHAYTLYERFRPDVPHGAAGWGSKGRLALSDVFLMAEGQPDSGENVGEQSAKQAEELLIARIRRLVNEKQGAALEVIQKMGSSDDIQASIQEMQLNGEAYVKDGRLMPL